jgi:hypothetical protein
LKILKKSIQSLNEEQLFGVFEKEAYGTYFRNITGVTEHSHYHLGQIFFLKKLLKIHRYNEKNS